MLTREEVVWAYRLILGREPESEAVIEACRRVPSREALRSAFFGSPEFAGTNKITWLNGRWVAAPVLGGDYLIWLDLGDRYVSFGCLFDDYEPAETRFVKSVLRPGEVFVDAGANIGWFTLLAASIVGESGAVHAFEPRIEIAGYLERTVALNRLERVVSIYRCGLAERAGEATIAWSIGSDNPGGSFLMPDTPPAGMGWDKAALRALDELRLPRLDFMKVDVEGAEMRVFAGARETIARCRPVILSELYPEMLERVSGAPAADYFSLFAELGYRCCIVDLERCGEEVRGFPVNWHKPLINLALIPAERAFDRKAAGFSPC